MSTEIAVTNTETPASTEQAKKPRDPAIMRDRSHIYMRALDHELIKSSDWATASAAAAKAVEEFDKAITDVQP